MITTAEAAQVAGVSEATIWKWHQRGYLTPCRKGDTYRWHEDDVWRCARDRMPSTRHAVLDALWSDVLAHGHINCQAGVRQA